MQSRPNRPPVPFGPAGTGLVSSHLIRAQILSPSTSTCTAAGGPISLTDVGLGLGSFAPPPPPQEHSGPLHSPVPSRAGRDSAGPTVRPAAPPRAEGRSRRKRPSRQL